VAEALETCSGCITVEPDFESAQRLALGGILKARPGLSEHHIRERDAHYVQQRHLLTNISGPEWGIFLGPSHLEKLSISEIEHTRVFDIVQSIGERLAFVAITRDPEDALALDFDANLDRARAVLAPLLMDLSVGS
jgi:hypothetical protein